MEKSAVAAALHFDNGIAPSEYDSASIFAKPVNRTVENLDLIREADLRTLAQESYASEERCISVLMPTYRHGPETLQGPIRLRRLISQAETELALAGTADAVSQQLLGPIRALVDDVAYWQHQGDGVAIYSWVNGSIDFRLPLALDEQCVVSASLRVRPLLPLLSDSGKFRILSLTQNSVRLFEATRFKIMELDLGDTPKSMDAALVNEDHEPQMQMHSGGNGPAITHGHGVGEEIDKETVSRFFRAVDRGLSQHFDMNEYPLVLACVGYYLPIFRSVSAGTTIVGTAIEGTVGHRSMADLHTAAWPLVEPLFAKSAQRSLEQYANAMGTGLTATTIGELAIRASEGRIDSLFVTTGCAPRWGTFDSETGVVATTSERQPLDEDLLDRVVLETFRHGGSVFATVKQPEPGVDVGALLRH